MAIPTWTPGEVLVSSDVNTWFVPRAAVKVSATSRANSTQSADPELTLPVDSSAIYHLTVVLHFDGPTAGDIQVQWAAPAGTAMTMVLMGLVATAALNTDDVTFGAPTASPWAVAAGCLGAGTNTALMLAGTVVTSSTAGTLALNWAQQTTNATPTILHVGSMMKLDRIG